MPVAEASIQALKPSQFTKNDPRRYVKQKGDITHVKRLRMAERIARKLDPTKDPFDVHLMKRAYEKDGVLMKVADKLYPNATPELNQSEITINKVEVFIDYGTAKSDIPNQAQRGVSQGNYIDIEASSMSA